MNKNAKKWVRALRSGRYKQGILQLRDGEEFCCLGVACDLAVKNGVLKRYRGSAAGLPISVQKWLGLAADTGDFEENTQSLAELNDDGATFTRIAQIIESEPEGLFTK